MKTIGIIGGLGSPSTVKYYERLNKVVSKYLGKSSTAKIMLSSVNNNEIDEFRLSDDDEGEGVFFANEAKKLEQAGADCILIASNTSHKNALYVEAAVSIPFIHLADATAEYIISRGVCDVGFIGTSRTIEGDFYLPKFEKVGINIITPDKEDRFFINSAIYNEMIEGIVRPEVNAEFIKIIARLESSGAKAIILGCTELTLLDLSDVGVPIFDTVKIHVRAALNLIFKKED